jgi:hypothetical protein
MTHRFVCNHAKFREIKPEDFNIEGAIYMAKVGFIESRQRKFNKMFFYHRRKNLTNDFTILSNAYNPKIKEYAVVLPMRFLVEQHLFFCHSRRRCYRNYDDGEVLGSLIGSINLKTMKIDFTQKISSTQIEGLTLYPIQKKKIEFCSVKTRTLKLKQIFTN